MGVSRAGVLHGSSFASRCQVWRCSVMVWHEHWSYVCGSVLLVRFTHRTTAYSARYPRHAHHGNMPDFTTTLQL